jgi:hypothetical protein
MGSSIGSLVGGAAGFALGGPAGASLGMGLGGAAGNLLGGSMQGGSSASAQGNAGSSIYGAGQYGQTSSQFNPIGITTNFGKSNFTRDPTTGQITAAGYSLDPRLQGISSGVLGNAVNYDPSKVGQAAQPLFGGASSAFNLGQQYLAQSPEQAAQDYLALQRNLMAPGYEQQLAGIRNAQFQTGRTGLATGGTTAGSLMQTNPELAAFYNAKANSDRALAAQADEYGQKRSAFGLGLFGTGGGLLAQVPGLTSAGYTPLNTMLGTANTIEGMGQNAFDLSTTLGAGQSTANANAARFGLLGAQAAAPYQVANQSYNPAANILQGTSGSGSMGQLGSQLGNYVGDFLGGGTGMGLLNSSKTSGDYMNNIGATSSGPLGSSNAFANEWWM